MPLSAKLNRAVSDSHFTIKRLFSQITTFRSSRADIAAARRHRRDGDTLAFLCEVHQDLSATPPRDRRNLVFFAHFDPHGVVDDYVVRYLESLYRLGTTIVFVSGSPKLDPESVEPIRAFCAGIFTRQTLALDFGSWHLAWAILHDRGWTLDQFDRLVLANDSVFGPLYPLEEMWNTFDGADMYGSIESYERDRHLQSFFLCWDLNARTKTFLNDFWGNFRYVIDKYALIGYYEIGIASRAREHGLSIKPFVSVAAISGKSTEWADHPWSRWLPAADVNNAMYFWDKLIEDFRFPFLKTSLPKNNVPWHDSMATLREFIETKTDYPYGLIEAYVARMGLGPTTWKLPAKKWELPRPSAPGTDHDRTAERESLHRNH